MGCRGFGRVPAMFMCSRGCTFCRRNTARVACFLGVLRRGLHVFVGMLQHGLHAFCRRATTGVSLTVGMLRQGLYVFVGVLRQGLHTV